MQVDNSQDISSNTNFSNPMFAEDKHVSIVLL